MPITYSFFSHPGKNKKQNEDALSILKTEDGLLIAVCDGIGGTTNSHIAAQICADSIKTFFSNTKNQNILKRIKDSINSVNHNIFKYSVETDLDNKISTTADVVFVNENFAYWGHVGDSRIYHYKNNTLHRMTKDHSIVQKLIDEGFLKMSDADNHHTRNMIYSAVGESRKLKIDLSKLKLNSNDLHFFLLCTDGVTSAISDEEISEAFSLNDPQTISDYLEIKLKKRNPIDDFSLVVVRIDKH